MNIVLLVFLLIAAFLYLLKTARRAQASTLAASAPRFQVRIKAFCPHCRVPVDERTINRLHAELGHWRRGTFYRPCAHCGKDLKIIVEQQS